MGLSGQPHGGVEKVSVMSFYPVIDFRCYSLGVRSTKCLSCLFDCAFSPLLLVDLVSFS